MNKTGTLRNVAIVGASRIPFCRAGTAYADLTNLDMLVSALQGLVDRYNLHGVQLDEVVAGAVSNHPKDFNLAREAVLGTSLSPLTPGISLQQACGTSLQAAFGIAAKIACGQIECGIAAGADSASDPPILFSRKFSQRLVKLSKAKTLGEKFSVFKGFSMSELSPVAPAIAEPRTELSMGEHAELMAREWKIERAEQDELALASHNRAQAAYADCFFDDLLSPCAGMLRDNNLRYDLTLEQLSGLKPVFDRSATGTLTAGNSSALTDGAASLLLASEDWAAENGLPVLARLTHMETAAVDHVSGEGLLMAPTVAVANMLRKAGLSLQDFDYYEVHEAFAAQVLCTLKAWESEEYCRERLGLDAALGSIDRSKLNIVGSSLALGHPFAATGARIAGTLAKLLNEAGQGRGLISICTAGGMGVAAILEK
ncbi:acetyl-CoA C-acetyltransferase [Porticoccus litoralis]|uniref:Acetyl-CoA C-acetyltransferase n=1 Tax=Porticoccus litoralis TaxID=434086 RepID=A0AAW8B4P4_9GAMM|nr:acetyl-CoA C-acetyltransferase [Porticoccus litoralis]MDP1520430.1 acetyl-CoA C-acetyltransferase [Porticoccus litoralis]